MLCHLDFAYVGAAVLRLKGSAVVVCDALSGVLPGVHQCFGCGFLMPHRSAKSGCFGRYLNVFAGFSSGFVVFYESFWNLSRIEF